MEALPPRKDGGAVLLPRATFSTAWVDPLHRTDAWREVVNFVYDVAPVEGEHRDALGGTIETYSVGPLSIGRHTFRAQQSRRDAERIRATGADALLLQLFTEGSIAGTFGDLEAHARPGDICLCDYRRPMEAVASAGSTISVVLPRMILTERLGYREVHGLVLDGRRPLTRVLANHLHGLMDLLPDAAHADGPEIADLTTAMVARVIAGMTSTAPNGPSSRTGSLRDEILRHIHEQLCSSDLTPVQLESQFGLSRTSLYRLFVAEGGVSRVIQRCRLDRAHAMLRQGRHTVLETALALGFSSEQHLARAFKARYGMTPGAARGVSNASGNPAELHTQLVDRLSRFRGSIQPPPGASLDPP